MPKPLNVLYFYRLGRRVVTMPSRPSKETWTASAETPRCIRHHLHSLRNQVHSVTHYSSSYVLFKTLLGSLISGPDRTDPLNTSHFKLRRSSFPLNHKVALQMFLWIIAVSSSTCTTSQFYFLPEQMLASH